MLAPVPHGGRRASGTGARERGARATLSKPTGKGWTRGVQPPTPRRWSGPGAGPGATGALVPPPGGLFPVQSGSLDSGAGGPPTYPPGA